MQNQQQNAKPSRVRLVPRGRDGTAPITTGRRKKHLNDLYVELLAASWIRLLALILMLNLTINISFALGYLAIGDGIENARPGSFADAFFFSVQTLATIGYGKMVPHGLAANLLVTLETMTGFGFFAVVTGLVFSKFSRPTARVLFSNVAVICPYNGVPHLMLRLANERNNRIVDANVHVVLLREEMTKEGHDMRRFHDLNLVRSRVPVIRLTWTVMHPIDENSPLYHACAESLRDSETEIVVSLIGLDETLSQTIHTRYSYVADEIKCNAMFEDVIQQRDDGRIAVDYRKFHKVKPLPPAPTPSGGM